MAGDFTVLYVPILIALILSLYWRDRPVRRALIVSAGAGWTLLGSLFFWAVQTKPIYGSADYAISREGMSDYIAGVKAQIVYIAPYYLGLWLTVLTLAVAFILGTSEQPCR